MPNRGDRKPTIRRSSAPEEGRPVNLEFLPRDIVERIDDIFDSYYGLGMRKRLDGSVDDYAPSFPRRLSSLTSQDLGDTLGDYTAWYSYTADKLKYIAVAYGHLDSEMEKIINSHLGTMVEDKGNIEAKKARAKSSEEYVSLLTYAQKLRGIKSMLELELSNYDKCIATLSREVSRRESSGGF